MTQWESPESSDSVRLRWHLLVLIVGLAGVWPLLHFDGVFTVDEGSYALQARTLGQGTWDMGYAFIDADPAGRYVPYHGAVVVDGRAIPYPKHPLVPEMMRWAAVPFGEEVGFRVLGVLSVVALSALAWAIAGEVGGPRARPWAFWLAAASPVLANAWLLWPHSLSACVGALLTWAGLRSRRGWAWLALAVFATAVGVLLRSEGVLWAAAVGSALVLSASSLRQRLCGIVVVLTVGGSLLLEREWRNDILGGGVVTSLGLEARAPGSGLSERLGGLRTAVLDPAVASDAGTLLGLLVVSFVVVASIQMVRHRSLEGGVGFLLIGAATLLTARCIVAEDDPLLGLFVAAPTLLMALACTRIARDVAWPVIAMLLFGAALAMTIYVDGGAFQWGGRFISPLLGVLAALAGVAISDRLPSNGGGRNRAHRLFSTGVVCLLVVQGVAAILIPDRMRDAARQRLESVTRYEEDVNIAMGQMIPRMDWRAWPGRCWISIPATGGVRDAQAVLKVLAHSGVATAAYAGVKPSVLEAAGAVVHPDSTNPVVGTLDVPGPLGSRDISEPYECRG